MKKSFTNLKSITLALTVFLILGLMSNSSMSAKSAPSSMARSAASLTLRAAAASAQTSTMSMPTTVVYALSNTSTIYVLTNTTTGLAFTRLVRPGPIFGNLIGLDFRPADGNSNSVYGLTDTGRLYKIDLSSTNLGAATLVSTMTPRFPGGYQSLMDFNPVVNAIRLIASSGENYAVVSANGDLNTTAVQTSLTYAANDVNAGVKPKISAGAYNNNLAGATNTIFYAIDYDLDTFATVAPPLTATGSSNTGGGIMQTIGPIVTPTGARVNFSSTDDIDIYTATDGTDYLVGISGGNILFNIDLAQINPSLPVGTTQNVVVRAIAVSTPSPDLNFIDIALKPAVRQQ